MAKTKTSAKVPEAIPTIYAGVQLKSRLEAQMAYLFDTFRIPWRYECTSMMLPSGILYTPDFWLPYHMAVVECRGYHSAKGERQLESFGEQIQLGNIKSKSTVNEKWWPLKSFLL